VILTTKVIMRILVILIMAIMTIHL
jgi:hypothetical protein